LISLSREPAAPELICVGNASPHQPLPRGTSPPPIGDSLSLIFIFLFYFLGAPFYFDFFPRSQD
jgi:hypothetical protein